MCYFVVFQPSKVEMLIFRFQRLNFDQFDPFSQMTARSLLNKFKKLRKSEPGGGSEQEISVLFIQGEDT
jgi:hypothetical protein